MGLAGGSRSVKACLWRPIKKWATLLLNMLPTLTVAQKLNYRLKPLKLWARTNLTFIRHLSLYSQCLSNHCFPEIQLGEKPQPPKERELWLQRSTNHRSHKQKWKFIAEHRGTCFAILVSNARFWEANATRDQLRQHCNKGAFPHIYWLLTMQTLRP